jgi:hypothetical protein
MKSAQYLLAALGLVGAASAWGSGWSNETTVWTTITTDVSTLPKQESFLGQISPELLPLLKRCLGPRDPRAPRVSLFHGKANTRPRSTLRTALRAQPSLKAPRHTLPRPLKLSRSLVSFPSQTDFNLFANPTSRLPLHHREANHQASQADHFCCSSPTTSIQWHLGPSCLDYHH